jgi:hypothetical protein
VSNETEATLLKAVLEQYATPDPKIVGTIPRNGQSLSYVSHAEITRILIEIDPMWNWQPVAWQDGRPATHEANGMITMWGTLTLLGKDLIGVGSVRSDKPDYEKELVGDFLRNAAMRFGICLSLWTKQDQSSQSPIRSLPSAHPAQGMSADQVEQSFVQAANVIKIGGVISDKQKGLISSLGKEVADGDIQPIIQELFEKTNLNTLTTKEGSELIKHLMGMRKSEPAF